VAIDPRTGRVRARFTLPELLNQAEAAGADVANGMAYDPESRRFWITGKFWPRLFELRQRP
jgi:glutamine cyclotransferase